MSGVHKYPTISFRISPREREEIEAKILASGMSKRDYFVRSCIYNRVCVVGKKELIYQLVEELKIMQPYSLYTGSLNPSDNFMFHIRLCKSEHSLIRHNPV